GELRRAVSRATPYKGLVTFGRDDTSVFFGRSRIVGLIKERLERERFVAIVGASGSGKSSLLRCGLAHDGGETAMVITPSGAAPIPTTLPGGLLVDQFEEVFSTMGTDARHAFTDDLFDRLDRGSVQWLAIAVRGDFYAQCGFHSRLADALSDH